MSHLEVDSNIVFLYKCVEGAADGSYGLNVAKIAGIGEDILIEAQERAKLMESRDSGRVCDLRPPK